MENTKAKLEADIAKLANILDGKLSNWMEKYQAAENFSEFTRTILKELNKDVVNLSKKSIRQIEIKLLELQLAQVNKKIEEIKKEKIESGI